MFGRVKRWLGIEGVKLELILPEEVAASEAAIEGKIRFYSMHTQTVKGIRVRIVEKFKRGRRKNKVVDEYELGAIALEQDIEVPAEQYIEIDFTLPFILAKSDMDRLSDKNAVFRGVVSAAKFLKGVQSIYRVEAEADVKGTALNPFDKKDVGIVA